MNFDNKKSAKQLIRLAVAIGRASKLDIMILYSMTSIKMDDYEVCLADALELTNQIKNNVHLLALMKVKNKD